MMMAFDALWSDASLQRALLAGLLASIACGVIGSYVVVMRLGYLAGGVAHSVLGGIGVAIFYGAGASAGAFPAAVVAALVIGWVQLYGREHADTIISALWATGMALGVVLLSRVPAHSPDLQVYLFGDIAELSRADVYVLAALDIVTVTLAAVFHKQLLAVAFDAEHAQLRGVPVRAVYLLFLCLSALAIVAMIRLVGLILVIALVTLPAGIARQYARSLAAVIWFAAGTATVVTMAGITASSGPGLPAGPTIILIAGAAYFLSLLGRSRLLRRLSR